MSQNRHAGRTSSRTTTSTRRRNKAARLSWLESLEDRCLMAVTITEFPVTSDPTHRNIDITGPRGPKGHLWISEMASKVAEMSADGKVLNEFNLSSSGDYVGPQQIITDLNGNLWFGIVGGSSPTGGQKYGIGRLTPDGGFTSYPTQGYLPTYSITVAPDGNLWFLDSGGYIGTIAPNAAPGTIPTEYPVPNPRSVRDYSIGTITAGTDGYVYFVQNQNSLGRIDHAGAITTVPLPQNVNPYELITAPDGTLWFPDSHSRVSSIARFDPKTGALTEYPIPPASSSFGGLAFAPDGKHLWYAEQAGRMVGVLDTSMPPGTLPDLYTVDHGDPRFMTAGPDGNMWFTEMNSDFIGKVTITAPAAPKLDVSMQASAGTVGLGSDYFYTIPVKNNGSDTVFGATLTDVLPAGLQFLNNGSNGLYSDSDRTFTAVVGNLVPGASFTAKIHVQATQGGTIVNTANAFIGPPGNPIKVGSASATVNVGAALNLDFSMQVSGASVKAGDLLTYKIPVTNRSTAAVSGVQIIDPLPAGLEFVSGDPAWDGTSFGTVNVSGRVVSDLGRIDPGSTFTVKITARATQPGTYTNTAYAFGNTTDLTGASSDISKAPYSASADTVVTIAPASLVLDGHDRAKPVAVKDVVPFLWTLTNKGTTDAHNLTITIPEPLGQVSFTPFIRNVFREPNKEPAPLTFILDTLKAGESLDFGVVVKTGTVGQLSLTASVDSPNPIVGVTPPRLLSRTESVSVTDGTVALDLVGGVDVNPIAVFSGLATFTWTVTNHGPTSARGMSGSITTSPAMSFRPDKLLGIAGKATQTGLESTGLTLSFNLPELAAGQSRTFLVPISSSDVGANFVTASVNSSDPILGGGPLVKTVQLLVKAGDANTRHLTNPDRNKVLSHVSIDTIYLGAQWNSNATTYHLQDLRTNIDASLRTLVSGPYMDFLNQYGVGKGSVNDGLVIPSTPPANISDSDIADAIRSQISNHRLPNAPERLYIVFTPPGAVVTTDDGKNSVKNFRGYHTVRNTTSGVLYYFGVPFYYAVIPYQGTGNSVRAGLSPLQGTAAVLSHEVAEAVTDPDFFSKPAWRALNVKAPQNEIGDLCANKQLMNDPEGYSRDYGMLDGYDVQYEFANKYTYPGTNLTVKDDCVLPSRPARPNGTSGVGFGFTRIFPLTSGGGGGIRPSALPGIRAAAVPGFSFSGPVATFVDTQHPGTDPGIYRVDIDWGDGNNSLGAVAYDAGLGQFVVSSSHTFAQAAGSTADITLQLTDTTNGNAAGTGGTVPLQAATAPPARFAFSSATYAANRNGSDAVITVARAGDTSLESTVDYHVEGGTAVAGTDYQPEAGTLVFMPGQTVQVFTIPIYSDPSAAGDQTLNLVLSFPTGNAVLGGQASAVLTVHPSPAVFAPPMPALDPSSDTGSFANDGITADDGSAKAPLTFVVNGASIPDGFVQLYDVTDPAKPVALGTPAQASGGHATILVEGASLADGVHQFAVSVSQTATSPPSLLSQAATVTIDATPPVSSVAPLPAVTGSTVLTVRWSGTDASAGSGRATYDVSVSDNGGPFTPFLQGTTETSALFHGTNGHIYGFYSVATDEAGNVQATPAGAQATTAVAIPTLSIGGVGSVDEGSPYTLNLTASGPGAGAITSWLVNWGDGTLQTVGGKTTSLAHSYVASPGNVTISASATNPTGKFSAGNTVLVNVNNVAPSVTLSALHDARVGTPYTATGSFGDPGADTFAATVDYGDRSGVQPLALHADRTFALAHSYGRPGTFTVTVTVADQNHQTGQGTFSVVVTAPTSTSGPLDAFVASLYHDVLGRTMDPLGNHYWVGRRNAGVPQRRVASLIFNSSEHRALARSHLAPHISFPVALSHAIDAERQAVTISSAHPGGPVRSSRLRSR